MAEIIAEKQEMRAVLKSSLAEFMKESKDVIYLEADLAGALGTTSLMKDFPEQAFDVGIMEANMVGVASGMSLKGKVPFVHSFGTFASRRCADQTFISACYNKANVKILGSDPGVTAESNGGTHMPFEDIGVYRSFPGMTIFDVAEPQLFHAVLRKMRDTYGTIYIRFPRKEMTCYYPSEPEIEIGKGNIVREGNDATVIASGIEVEQAITAAENLSKQGIEVRVVDMFTIKPIDKDLILRCAKETKAVVAAENHNIYGGLCSAVSEVLAESGIGIPFRRVAVPDCFGEVGDKKFLSEKFHISEKDIEKAVKDLLR